MPYGTARLGPSGNRTRRLSLTTARSNLYRAATAAARRVGGGAATRNKLLVVPGITRSAGAYGRFNASRSSGLKPEKKFLDQNITGPMDATAENTYLTTIVQGDGPSNRDGKSCTIKSIEWKGTLTSGYLSGASTNGRTIVTLYIIQDTQTNGALASVLDVFTSTDLTLACMNLYNTGRFKVLMKKVIALNATAGVTTAIIDQIKYFQMFKKVNIPLVFTSTTGAVSEARSNSIFCCAGALGSDDVINLDSTVRLRFVG